MHEHNNTYLAPQERLMEMETEQVVIVQAQPADIDAVLGLLEDAACWLVARGIDQWRPGSFDRHDFAARIKRGEVYLALSGDQPAGTLTLQPSDPLFWPDAPDDALYLHKLAVCRAYAGQGIGRRLLEWAERTTAAAGKTYLRLDCMAESAAMRAYYEGAGFSYRSELSIRNWSASLYEKSVASSQ